MAEDPPDLAAGGRRPRWNWFVLLGAALVAALVVYVAVLNSPVGSQDEFEELLDDLGWWGPVVYIASMAALQPLGVPGLIFMVPAGLVWPAGAAIAYSWVGNMIASCIAFVFARRYGRERLRKRIPDRVLRYEQRVVDREYTSITILRVLTGQLVAADWFLGLSRVRALPFLVGTGIGILPGILLAVLLGSGLVELLLERPLVMAALAVVGLVPSLILRRRRRPAGAQPT